MLVDMSEKKICQESNLNDANDFAQKAAWAKTLSKVPKVDIRLELFKPMLNRKKIKREVKLQPGGFGETVLDYFD